MNEPQKKDTSSWILGISSLILLVAGLAPVGLFQIARSMGFDTASTNTPPLAIMVGLLFIGGLVFVGHKISIKAVFLILFGTALLNLAGCSTMWSDFSRISYINLKSIEMENKPCHTTSYKAP